MTLKGKIETIDFPNQVYGEWIIYEGLLPRYQINLFSELSSSDKKVKNYLDANRKANALEKVLEEINHNFDRQLKLSIRPYFSILMKSQIKEIELPTIPYQWIENI